MDTKALAEATAAIVRAHINETVTPLLKRIEELEDREFPDVDAKLVAAMEGVIDNDDVRAICEQLIGEIPKAINGKDGVDGKDGIDGKDGRDGVDGKDGTDGINGKDGLDGKNGRDGLDAREFIRANGRLIVTMSDGSTKDLGEIDGKPGEPGKDGKDGLGFDDIDMTYDGEKTFTVRFARPGDVKEFEFTVPVMIYRGIYREGQEYKQGDTVTWGGHLWHCDTDTTDKPDGEQRCWTMAVRKPRGGK